MLDSDLPYEVDGALAQGMKKKKEESDDDIQHRLATAEIAACEGVGGLVGRRESSKYVCLCVDGARYVIICRSLCEVRERVRVAVGGGWKGRIAVHSQYKGVNSNRATCTTRSGSKRSQRAHARAEESC